MKRAIVLLSGGMDSTVTLKIAQTAFDDVLALSFDYGQKHSQELQAASHVAHVLGVPHEAVQLPKLPQEPGSHVVHGRNLVLLAVAASVCTLRGYDSLAVGFSGEDAEEFPDCRPDFVMAARAAVSAGLGREIEIRTPLIYKSKAETWRLARELGILDLVREGTVTCYLGTGSWNEWGFGCGTCPACVKRARGWEEARL